MKVYDCKNKLGVEYYIGYWEIEEGDYLVPVIFLYKNVILQGIRLPIKYYSYGDFFTFDNSKFDENSIILNRQEARKLCELAKIFNPNTKYATGTKDLPVENYI